MNTNEIVDIIGMCSAGGCISFGIAFGWLRHWTLSIIFLVVGFGCIAGYIITH